MPARAAASIWLRMSASSGETMTDGPGPAGAQQGGSGEVDGRLAPASALHDQRAGMVGDQRPDRGPLILAQTGIWAGQRLQAALGLGAQRIRWWFGACHVPLLSGLADTGGGRRANWAAPDRWAGYASLGRERRMRVKIRQEAAPARIAAARLGPARLLRARLLSGGQRSARQGAVLLIVGVLALAGNLRSAITSLPPIFPELESALHISAASLALLAAVPVLCFGVFSGAAAPLSRRLGEERVLGMGLVLLAAGLLLRGLSPAALLFPGTVAAGAAIALMNVLLPSLVMRRMPEREGL